MALAQLGPPRRILLKSFQRWSSGLVQRAIQLLDGVARLSELSSHGGRRLSNCIQYMIFISGLNLLPDERCAILARDGLQCDGITFPHARDRALDSGCRSLADADFVRKLIGDAGARWNTHEAKHPLHSPVIHYSQKRRLFELDRQSLAKRAVKDRIAGVIDEIRQDDDIFVGEFLGAV